MRGSGGVSMHRVSSTGNAANAARPRKERRLTYVLRDSNDSKHCSGINSVTTTNPHARDGRDGFLFSGSRDGTIRRWELGEEAAVCRATFESHVDWVNDVVLTGEDTLVSCSSDTTIKTWRASSYGECTRTFRQHTDYVTSLAAARHTNVVASGGLGREVFLWDLEAAMKPVARAGNGGAEEAVFDRTLPSSTGPVPGPTSGGPGLDRSNFGSNNAAPPLSNPSSGYIPLPAKGHKESVYSLAINDAGTVLVSGGTEKAIRVWDPRTGAKQMKLKGHTDNVRALLLDSSERYCLSGSSDSMIRLWDLGQQRCIHSYAVHTDSVWALAATPSFSHVYSGGRDLSVYLTDLVSRESTLLFMEQHPVQKLALQGGEWLWVATTDSSLHKWPAQEKGHVKSLHRASSFVAGSLPFARARACLEGSAPTPMYSEPHTVISGNAGIVRHAILNDRRHVLTQDTAGIVKLWEITRGAVIEDYGKISLEEKEKEKFEMVSVPAWFTMDTRLGSIAIHLDTPNCFSAEMYAVDLQVPNASEELKLNLGQETLRGLLSHWLARRRPRSNLSHMPNGDGSHREGRHSENGSVRAATDDSHEDGENHHPHVLPAFEFSSALAPSIITEGSQGGLWRKKATELDGTDDDKDLPWWCIECVLHNRLPPREHAKCSFYLQPCDGTSLQILTQGKLSAPRILRIHKVVNYVLEKLIIDKPLDDSGSEGASSSGQTAHQANGHATFRPGLSSRVWQQQVKPVVEILCNSQVLPLDMSLATVRAYVWKKSDDLCLHYRVVPPTR